MNCNCISDLERRIADQHTRNTGVDMKADCQNVSMLLDPSSAGDSIHMTTFKVTGKAKGYSNGRKVSVTANFCPFCGKAVKS